MRSIVLLSILILFCFPFIKSMELHSPIKFLFYTLQQPQRVRAERLIRTIDPVFEDMDEVDERGWGILHYLACMDWGHAAVLMGKRWIAKGANVNIQNMRGATPLHCAIQYGHVEFAKMLIDHGADRTQSNSNGEIPLHVLLSKENALVPLLNQSIHQCHETFDVRTCKDNALNCITLLTEQPWRSLKERCVNILLDEPVSVLQKIVTILPEELQVAVVTQRIRSVDVDHDEDKELYSVLSFSTLLSLYGEIRTDASLLSLPINICDTIDGNTALHQAARSGACIEIIKRLISLGAARTLINKKKKEPYRLLYSFSCLCSSCRKDRELDEAKRILKYPFTAMEQITQELKKKRYGYADSTKVI